jgi:hypothetical protein
MLISLGVLSDGTSPVPRLQYTPVFDWPVRMRASTCTGCHTQGAIYRYGSATSSFGAVMANRPTWPDMKEAFAWHGAWNDIYVLDTDAHDWDRLLGAITSSDYSPTYSVEGEPAVLPGSFDEAAIGSAHLVLTLTNGVTIDCYFFTDDEIEFSLDPREVRGPQEFEVLLSFIAHVGRTVGKKVRLTPENSSHLPFVEFDPALDSWSKVMLAPRVPRGWCGRRDLNPHALRHENLNLACLPIPPRPLALTP